MYKKIDFLIFYVYNFLMRKGKLLKIIQHFSKLENNIVPSRFMLSHKKIISRIYGPYYLCNFFNNISTRSSSHQKVLANTQF